MSGGDLVRLAAAFIVAGSLVLAPFAAYGGTYLLTQSHFFSILWTTMVALAELVVVQLYLRRT